MIEEEPAVIPCQEQVQNLFHGRLYCRQHLGVIVAEYGTHLAGGEVKDGPSVAIVYVRSLSSFDQKGGKLSAIADQVFFDRFPEFSVFSVAHDGSKYSRRG